MAGRCLPSQKKALLSFLIADSENSSAVIIAHKKRPVFCNNNGLLYPRIEFAGISKKLLLQISKHLGSRGMKGKLYVSHKYENSRYFTPYRTQFNGRKNLETFRNKLGFFNSKHEQKYQKYRRDAGGEI